MDPYAEGDGWTLYCGDCREVMPRLPGPGIGAVITDPPYGVNLGDHKNRDGQKNGKGLYRRGYATYEDTPENFDAVVVPALKTALDKWSRGAVFCGFPSASKLPTPRAVGGVYLPAGCGRSSWGFTNFAHCLFYGQTPQTRLGCRPTGIMSGATIEDGGEHPCPKPLAWMRWVVSLSTLEGETVLDPFCGSGTTGVACRQLGRRFIGIEVDEGYCALAARNLASALNPQTYRDPRSIDSPLFDLAPPRAAR